MKILWITNTLFPAVCEELNIPTPVVGGWMYSAAESLKKIGTEVKLAVATVYHGKELKSLEIDDVVYFLIPQHKQKHLYDQRLEVYWRQIQNSFQPDITHIHGTEYPHGLAYLNECGSKNTVVSIQGLVSVYERYYYGGISRKTLFQNLTLRDIIRNDTIFRQRSIMQRRGDFEKSLIDSVNHVIGRTSWDESHVWAINPESSYHFCNETLRSSFYDSKWSQSDCEEHSIFLSQAHYPIKGLQQMIMALPLIIRKYPNTKVYVAGTDFFSSVKSWKLSGFGKYIRNLMAASGVKDQVIFTGMLSEEEMSKRYLKSNVFVCPSSIENSPNSVGEAQLLGVPCIAAYVGGVANMVADGETGLLYRFEETEMLARAICRIFDNKELAKELSVKGRTEALKRHDKITNTKTLISIYKEICKKL